MMSDLREELAKLRGKRPNLETGDVLKVERTASLSPRYKSETAREKMHRKMLAEVLEHTQGDFEPTSVQTELKVRQGRRVTAIHTIRMDGTPVSPSEVFSDYGFSVNHSSYQDGQMAATITDQNTHKERKKGALLLSRRRLQAAMLEHPQAFGNKLWAGNFHTYWNYSNPLGPFQATHELEWGSQEPPKFTTELPKFALEKRGFKLVRVNLIPNHSVWTVQHVVPKLKDDPQHERLKAFAGKVLKGIVQDQAVAFGPMGKFKSIRTRAQAVPFGKVKLTHVVVLKKT